MSNLGLPYILKHYIDIITQPGLAWSFDPASKLRRRSECRAGTCALRARRTHSITASLAATRR